MLPLYPQRLTKMNRYELITIIFTGIVALFTAVVAFATAFQLLAFIQSEKPVVGVTDIHFVNELKPSESPRLIIELKNKGKTTAFVQEFRLYGDGGMTVPENAAPQLTNVKPPILPEDSAHVELDVPIKFSQDYINGINKGEYHIWIVGVVKYSSRFWFGGGKSGFCFYYDPSRGRGVDSFYRCHDPRYEYAD